MMQNENESSRSKPMDKAISVCASLFLQRGIEDVKMTEIADQSEIGVATLYRHFGSKTGIAIAAMTYLWNQIREMYSDVFTSEIFLQQTGIKQVHDLMQMYVVMHQTHQDFLKALGEFDQFLLHEQVPKEELLEYEKSIINFYPVFAASFRSGIADGTVRRDVDMKLFYLTVSHALLEMSKKMVQGDILPSDDFSQAPSELGMLIEMAVDYLRNA